MTKVLRSENASEPVAPGTAAGASDGDASLPDPPFFGSFRRFRANVVPLQWVAYVKIDDVRLSSALKAAKLV
jgi:hypothetical protein